MYNLLRGSVNPLSHLDAFLNELRADAALVHRPENMHWIAGYTGEGMLFVSADRRVIVTDFRYIEQARRQAPDWERIMVGAGRAYPAEAAKLAGETGAGRILVETDYLTYDEYQGFARALEGVKLERMAGIPEALREIKDEAEIQSICRAGKIASDALMSILPRLHAGMTERQVAIMLAFEMLNLGSEGNAFEIIAAAGPNGALPHATPSDHVIQNGELLTLDFGATVDGYRSDMTRTIGFGSIGGELKGLYETVRAAQQEGLNTIGPGAVCGDVDKACRDVIEARYPAEVFGHSTGHGVGLYIHEQPRVSSGSATVLRPGHVVTVEPGIYIPGLGGCRIEDTVIITADGIINPIDAPKHLIELEPQGGSTAAPHSQNRHSY